LYTVSKDMSLAVVDTETGKVILKKPKAHSEPLNALLTINEQMVATGDEGGCVKVWDTRHRKVVMKYHENVDFIADMCFVAGKRTLLAASGDGCLSIFDIRKKKPVAVSANQDDELLSIEIVRNSTRAVVGTQSGTLLFFTWGDWGDCTDRFPGHPSSIDSLAGLDDTTVLTASSDGIIRAISVFPHRLVGVLGDHEDLPVECIRISGDRNWVGSCSHDQTVRFWDLSGLDEAGDGSDEEENEKPEAAKDSDDDSDDSDNSVEAKEKKRKKRKKAKRGIGGQAKSASGKSFFSGLD
ncbi:WD40-repeat-containing domain protein, partial [Blyttiomyces helicus]